MPGPVVIRPTSDPWGNVKAATSMVGMWQQGQVAQKELAQRERQQQASLNLQQQELRQRGQIAFAELGQRREANIAQFQQRERQFGAELGIREAGMRQAWNIEQGRLQMAQQVHDLNQRELGFRDVSRRIGVFMNMLKDPNLSYEDKDRITKSLAQTLGGRQMEEAMGVSLVEFSPATGKSMDLLAQKEREFKAKTLEVGAQKLDFESRLYQEENGGIEGGPTMRDRLWGILGRAAPPTPEETQKLSAAQAKGSVLGTAAGRIEAGIPLFKGTTVKGITPANLKTAQGMLPTNEQNDKAAVIFQAVANVVDARTAQLMAQQPELKWFATDALLKGGGKFGGQGLFTLSRSAESVAKNLAAGRDVQIKALKDWNRAILQEVKTWSIRMANLARQNPESFGMMMSSIYKSRGRTLTANDLRALQATYAGMLR